MKAVLRALGLLTGLCLLSTAGLAGAQEKNSPAATTAAAQKSETTAALYEYLLPVLGHAYAGDWSRGIAPGLVSIGGAGLALGGVNECIWEEECALLVLGGAIGLAGRIWGISSAIRTVREYNHRITAGSQVSWSVDPRMLSVGLRIWLGT